MTQLDSGTTVRTQRPRPNVYTVLAVIATLVLAAGVAYLWSANMELVEGQGADATHPFYVIPDK